MKLKYIVAISLVVILSFGYYVGNVISKESRTSSKVSSVEKAGNNNSITINKVIKYTSAENKELTNAQNLVKLGKYPIQKDVRVVSPLKYDKGIMIPQGTYIYKVDGSKIGLASRPFNMYAISNTATIKEDSNNPLQTKPSPYNVDSISTNTKKLNIIGAINGYYYVSYNELGSSNVSYAFVKPASIALKGNTRPRQLNYISEQNLKLHRLANVSDYKVSGFNIYKTSYMLSNVQCTLSYNELKNFTPVVIATVGDALEIYYNGKVGWIHSDRLISF